MKSTCVLLEQLSVYSFIAVMRKGRVLEGIVSSRSWAWKMIGFVLFAVGSGPCAVAQKEPTESPNLSELRALSYQKMTQLTSASSLPSFQDVADTIRMAAGYSRGIQLLPNYREPILTRGNTGVSVFRNASPSVVLVVVGDVKNKQFDPTVFGAGVVIDSSGDILTNWHVITGYSAAVIFFKPQGKADIEDSNAYVARVIAQNEVSDLALLHLAKSPSALLPISIGNISLVQVAEDIHVIGHPNGNLWSYSTGVVSQIRDGYNWTYSDGSKHEAKVLQLQTAINPGNSGGPVLDDQGKLLGLIAMSEAGQNLDYAVAADVIQSFILSTASIRTRGAGGGESSQESAYFSGHLVDGRTVFKVVSSNLVEYVVTDATGKTYELAAETPDGVNVVAWDPNSFGGFKEWSIALPNRPVIRARGNAAAPDQFSSK
jgi:S1-C subfamily serine protease